MITEITLDGVASYKKKTTLFTDKKVNIIYGLNGSGKSTFSNYFYDYDNPKYNQCTHNVGDVSILVYNQSFIKENFYDKDSLHGIFSLSKENKDAKQKVEAVTLEIEKLAKDREAIQKEIDVQEQLITTAKLKAQVKAWEIKTNYSGGDRVLEFCLKGKMGGKEVLLNHLASIPLLQSKPTKTIATLKNEANAIDGDNATKYAVLSPLSSYKLSDEDNDSLQELILGSEDSPVSKLILKLQNSDWVSDGLKYIENLEDGQCPFCQSKTITDSFTKQIKDYFDESYQDSVNGIKSIESQYETTIAQFPSLDEYKQTPFSASNLADLTKYHGQISNGLESNLTLIRQKVSNPSLRIILTDMSDSVDNFNILIDKINKEIVEHNTRIDNSSTELEKIRNEFWSILRFEYDLTISTFNDAKNKAVKVIDTKQKELNDKTVVETEKNEERVKYQKSTVNIEDAIRNINLGLTEIGITDFHIEKYEDDLYRLVRTDTNDKIFSSLSEGEKMIISFLYFRELFRGKQSATEGQVKKIAIIDDPVSSLSHIFVYNIGQILKNDFFNSTSVEQVFVLTHSLYFFYELTDANHKRRKETQNLFRLSKNTTGSSISNMKYEEVQNDYQSYWSVINDDKQPPALIANCMRNIIEYFFNFVQKEDLSNVIQKPELKEQRFQAFVRYINRESHSLGQNIFDFKEFDYNDFKEGLRLVFDVTGYNSHYNRMAKITA
ncbi:AAA family ATPase [Vibrio gigantis]|uniref:AAA family ATPase n=1 Tax=Vibrio gigantis TaxID=296199 RepID=A0A5M9P4E7_9VIBR|nr:AAA family ATPase [Vibrio gigantis]KAA8679665.1 AAA family ATPase [Vibrio gigantis]